MISGTLIITAATIRTVSHPFVAEAQSTNSIYYESDQHIISNRQYLVLYLVLSTVLSTLVTAHGEMTTYVKAQMVRINAE